MRIKSDQEVISNEILLATRIFSLVFRFLGVRTSVLGTTGRSNAGAVAFEICITHYSSKKCLAVVQTNKKRGSKGTKWSKRCLNMTGQNPRAWLPAQTRRSKQRLRPLTFYTINLDKLKGLFKYTSNLAIIGSYLSQNSTFASRHLFIVMPAFVICGQFPFEDIQIAKQILHMVLHQVCLLLIHIH